jgi:GTP-binding protein HflX
MSVSMYLRPRMFETAKKAETAVLVGVISQMQSKEKAEEYLDELAFLAETAGAQTRARFLQKLDRPDSRTFVGKGKLMEIADYIAADEIDIVIFDDELTASQIRNIEQVIKCKIIDRSNLILDIFAGRARTVQAKTQVELAQCQYLLPRLTRMWTHLSKQKGGIGMKGPGEKEIETDRRIIRDRISFLKEKLQDIDRQNQTQRKGRSAMARVALVGYTNVGKSTLMNVLAKADVFAENKLFATLDATVRKITFDQTPFLLSDTVGFIRKIPHHLIESFKSTLDEVREADILLHVLDLSHPNFEEQLVVVEETLKDLKSLDKPILLVFNKADAYLEKHPDTSIEQLENTWMARSRSSVFISATERIGIERLREKISVMLTEMNTGKPFSN